MKSQPASTDSSEPNHPGYRLALALLAILLCLASVEVLLRILATGQSQGLQHDRPQAFYYPDASRLNPWGRDHPDPLRIAVVGDSITIGHGVQYYDTYGMRLEALLNLNADQRPAHVRIWATGGDSTRTQLRYLPDILSWEPEILILGICLNDTENPHRPEEYRKWRQAALPPPPPRALAALLKYTRLGTWIYQQYANMRSGRGYHAYYRKLYDQQYSGWEVFVRSLRAFATTCREQHIAFIPVIFPTMDNVDRYPFTWIHDQIGEVLRTEDIFYLDLLDLFRGQSPQRLQAIPHVDPHPSEIAHRQTAEAILHFLLANDLIDTGFVPQHTNMTHERIWQFIAGFLYDVTTVEGEEYRRLQGPAHGHTTPAGP